MVFSAIDFSKNLIQWYLNNKRELPWRDINDPYRIWLSEIILQQTRVEQGKPYYSKFLRAYPTVGDLASAKEDEVMRLWQGLGYYSRARNLHATAKMVAHEMKGKFPGTYIGLKKLKGVGDYTASAIASICYGEAQAVVDGNVYRVLSRVYGIDDPIDTTVGQKKFRALAQQLIPTDDPATYNQAIMEFGATHCKPKNPHCPQCPFNDKCVALSTNTVDILPKKQGKIKVRDRYFHFVILRAKDKVALVRRDKKGIWHGLYQFPLVETEKKTNDTEVGLLIGASILEGDLSRFVFALSEKETPAKMLALKKLTEKPVLHKLSHQNLYIDFYALEVAKINEEYAVPIDMIDSYALPRAIDRFLEGYKFYV
ncbi:MAG: A/G-specific adenine glycosylase [Cytophagaceae bacterium]|nr:A/G-specific adenine glycosylase [Cytophagaceae bacterium]|tara:strand:+ start:11281 stop:12387 length:1107 start_codon:yes stop_codon:yes gene_type:complete